MNQRLVIRLLEKAGHKVSVVNNGSEAVLAVEEAIHNGNDSYGAVLMDVQMPVMDGLEATAAIRRGEKLTGAHLPIIAMTAHAMKGDRERCLQSGMDDYLSKPINANDLLQTLEKWALRWKESETLFDSKPVIV